MTRYRYLALTADGTRLHGELDLPNENAVAARVQRDGLIPLSILPLDGPKSFRTSGLGAMLGQSVTGGPTLRRSEIAGLMRELSLMLGAGQDLDRALRYVVETTPRPSARAIMSDLRDRVRDGGALADAMTAHPRSFPRLHVGLVRAGEAGGALATVLEELASYLERQASQTASLRSAMIYPALLVVASISAIILLLTEILPQFVPLFQENGATLPRPTRIVIAAGDLVANDGLFALFALLIAGILIRYALRTPTIRLAADRTLLHLPILGSLTREIMAARLSRTLGTLLKNGVALIPSLTIAREVVGNTAGISAVDTASLAAREGGGLARPLANSGLFPRRMTDLMALGEETAQLGPLCLRSADIHEEQVRTKLQRLTALLVPAVTIVMGAVVAGIVSSLLLAMLSLNDLAQ